MSLCLNPDCLAVNPETHKFCHKCGQKLWLKERYSELKLIGQGGFGKTFLAVDLDKPSRPHCVIKQFFPQGQGTGALAKAAELFQEEAKRLDELGRHNQIPELLAYFIAEDRRQYLVQEYVPGQNLAQELASQGVFNEAKVRALLADLLPVLDFIHRNQVIHRDIKPENIIRRQGDQKLVLVDFGAAKAVNPQNRSVTGTVIGTQSFSAPEQNLGKAVNASDLYSLGVTCLYLLTGIAPIEFFDVEQHEWRWRDYLVNNPVSAQFGAVLDKLVIFGTKKRYSGAGEVLQDLGVIQGQTPAPSVKTLIQIPSSNPQMLTQLLSGDIKLELVKIPTGSFLMGSNESDREKPIHQVSIKEFYLGKYPVTQEQWQAVMGNNPSHFRGNLLNRKSKNPVEQVSWHDCQEFCQKLSQATGKTYRLPSEAEWEYACRAGTQTRYYFGDDENQLEDYAWYRDSSGHETYPVGQKKPNAWGLYDMHGNVWEWCEDSWHDKYQGAPTDGIPWIDNHLQNRVVRSGSWFYDPRDCRSAYRNHSNPANQIINGGFRVACVF